MLKSWVFLTFVVAMLTVLTALLVPGLSPAKDDRAALLDGKRQLVSQLGLTDLALCSEARYTRHPSQADLFAAFQDFPAAFEHFPTGSMIPPQPTGFSRRLQVIRSGER